MKINHILSIIILISTIMSCTDEYDGEGYKQVVKFSTIGGEVVPDNKGWLPSDEIGIYMYKAGTTIIEGNSENREYKSNGDHNFMPVTPDQTIYYPASGGKVDFVSYYPYNRNIQDNVTDIDVSDQTEQQDIDLLYSNNVKNNSATNGIVNLGYKHQLSKLVFIIKTDGKDAPELNGLKIEIEGTNTTAKFSILNAEISAQNNKQVIVMKTKESGTISEAILLPTPTLVAERKAIFKTNAGTYVWQIPQSTIFESGKRYTYNVIIHKNEVIVLLPEIEPWVIGNTIEGETSPKYNVGDYYPDSENEKTAEGVVFWVRPGSGNREGKILALKESAPLTWGASVTTKAQSTKGLENQQTIKALDPTLNKYPSFKWAGAIGDGWYLPSLSELQTLYVAWSYDPELFHIQLAIADGDLVTIDDVFWSSNESSATNAQSFSFENVITSSSKSKSHNLRAIKDFQK